MGRVCGVVQARQMGPSTGMGCWDSESLWCQRWTWSLLAWVSTSWTTLTRYHLISGVTVVSRGWTEMLLGMSFDHNACVGSEMCRAADTACRILLRSYPDQDLAIGLGNHRWTRM